MTVLILGFYSVGRLMLRERSTIPPYGPTRGMLQALELMRRASPQKVDGNFLRRHQIAPGNEYKVVGALRYLGLIDEEGRPTEKSRLLKTKGAAFTSALKDIVRQAYRGLFQWLGERGNSPDEIYNYFVTQEGLGVEMATKTTRFFVQLCHLAEIDLGFDLRTRAGRVSAAEKMQRGGGRSGNSDNPKAPHFPLILALTPEVTSLDTEELAKLFQKLHLAMKKALDSTSENTSP